MEELLSEKFQYATITPFKDYCRIDDKDRLSRSITENLDFLDYDDVRPTLRSVENYFNRESKVRDQRPIGKIVSLPEKKKKKVFYAATTDPIQESFQLTYYVKKDRLGHCSYQTTNDRHIKNHYGRPLSEISVTTVERSIRRHGDKITIKLYRQDKHRGFNCIYFKKSFMVQSVTINMVTGNFTTLNLTSRGGRNAQKSQTFRTNSFQSLHNLITGASFFTIKSKMINEYSRLYGDYQNSFDDILFTTKIQESLGIENGFVDYSLDPTKFVNDLLNFFVNTKKIKVPNGDYEHLITKLYPTEKFLKKNERKLVASVLDMLGIKTKATIKILHEFPNIDLFGLCRFIKFFDSDYSKYIGNINPEVFKNSYKKYTLGNYNDITDKSFILQNNKRIFGLKDIEKENLIRIVNSFNHTNSDNVLSERFVQLVEDHIRMIERIREYDPNLYMKARTMVEFNNEHRELSKMIAAIKKGWVIEYQYDDKLLDDLESPLKCLRDDLTLHTLYPYILKREEDYVEEGSFMHHCVASYSDKDKSMIVSLRDESGMDRVTCEFDITSGRCIQQRYFCNANPPTTFEDGLLIISQKIERHARWGTLNWKDKKKVPVMINGVEITKELPVVRVTDIFEDLRLPFQN